MTGEEGFDFRSLPFAEAVRWLALHGEPVDPRPDIDTASLKRRFARVAGVETVDTPIEGPRGRTVPARLYRDPSATASGKALVWVHGGGFIGGHLDMPESNWVALELAARGIPVLAVDYVKCLGDVHFPEPSDDVLAAWTYANSHSQTMFGVSAEALVLGGASAGANLAAGAVARLRDAGAPVPGGLILVYPVLHPNGPAGSATVDPDSIHGELALNFVGSHEALTDPHAFAGLGSVAVRDLSRASPLLCGWSSVGRGQTSGGLSCGCRRQTPSRSATFVQTHRFGQPNPAISCAGGITVARSVTASRRRRHAAYGRSLRLTSYAWTSRTSGSPRTPISISSLPARCGTLVRTSSASRSGSTSSAETR